MTPLEFFHSAAVEQALSRAAKAAAVPVSLHYVEHAEESPKILGYGQCAVCRMVAELPGGRAVCRAARLTASQAVLERGKPFSFVCHMGLGCVVLPAMQDMADGFVMTWGPFCPAEEPRALRHGVARGFQDLDAPEMPADLESILADVRVVPSTAIPTIAEWTSEVLLALWQAAAVAEAEPVLEPEPSPTDTRRRRRAPVPDADPYRGGAIAAALGAGDQTQARALLRAALTEIGKGGRARIAVRRAHVLALISATLEAAEHARIDVVKCWDGFDRMVEEIRRARTDEQLVEAGMRLLATIQRKVRKRTDAVAKGFVALNQYVMERLPDKMTLNEVAAALGEQPSTITHRLQRKFGMSFSEYTGRMRVEKAKELLRRTKLSVSGIAKRVGASDASSFGKLFRRFEHMSPVQYRKQYGKK